MGHLCLSGPRIHRGFALFRPRCALRSPFRLLHIRSASVVSLAFAVALFSPSAVCATVPDEPWGSDLPGAVQCARRSECISRRECDRGPAFERGWRTLAVEMPNSHVASVAAGSYGDTFGLCGLANTPCFGDLVVTVHLGDLAPGSSFTFPVNLSPFSRAILAKGPQGTRTGNAAVAGVVTLETRTPGEPRTRRQPLRARRWACPRPPGGHSQGAPYNQNSNSSEHDLLAPGISVAARTRAKPGRQEIAALGRRFPTATRRAR